MDEFPDADGRGNGTVLFAGTTVDVVVPAGDTGGTFSLLRIANPPGCWTPPHLHRHEDETVFVLSGTVRADTEDAVLHLRPGQAATLPRGRPHRMGNPGEAPAQLLVLCAPGGFEHLVRAAGRPSVPADDPAMTGADVARLTDAAPRHGVVLLPPDALRPGAPVREPAVPEPLDVLGVTVQVLAGFGPADDDLGLLRGCVPPGGLVPLHSHADVEWLYGLDGTLEVSLGTAGWRPLGPGEVAHLPGGVPHALRNRGDKPADVLLVTTGRMAGLFREVGCPPGSVPPGPPGPDRLAAFAAACGARGFWLAGAAENAGLGLPVG